MRNPDCIESREEYDSFVAHLPADCRWQWWPVPWRLATWSERIVKVAIWVVSGAFGVAAFLAFMYVVVIFAENNDKINIEHDRCLKHATNGLEIRECG